MATRHNSTSTTCSGLAQVTWLSGNLILVPGNTCSVNHTLVSGSWSEVAKSAHLVAKSMPGFGDAGEPSDKDGKRKRREEMFMTN